MTIQFRAQKVTVHEQALDEAQRRLSGGLFSLGEDNELELEWRVRESSSTYVGSEPWGVNHHLWRIEQVERLACERLLLAGLDLEPYDYAEQASDEGVVRLAARALISEADLRILEQTSGVIEVVRVGISDTPRRMRLDGYVWGERPEGVAVVLACTDVREPRVTLNGFEPGSPTEDFEDLAALADVDQGALYRRRHAARRVANVDAWPLSP